MPSQPPKFSPFPFAALRSLSRADAAIESSLARWLRARPLGARLAALAGGPVRARITGVTRMPFDPHAAHAEVRLGGESIIVACAARPLRALAQKTFGGPPELAAPRALTAAEEALWVLVVAAALDDTRAPAEVWPSDGLPPGATIARDLATSPARVHREGARILAPGTAPASPGDVTRVVVAGARTLVDTATLVEPPLPLAPTVAATPPAKPSTHIAIELVIERHAEPGSPWTVIAYLPRSIEVRVPPPRPLPAWQVELAVIVGRCTIERGDAARLRLRDVVTVERGLALVVGTGTIGLAAAPEAVEARVATGYVPGPMTIALADAAQLELTVQVGAVRMSLRELGELVPGAVVPLGKPLAGPYELRVAGRLIGRGELVDVDGELGVRIVSLEE